MKCPACQYVCSDLRDICPRCYTDLRAQKEALGIKVTNPEAGYEELLQTVVKTSPRKKGSKKGKGGGLFSKAAALFKTAAPEREKPAKTEPQPEQEEKKIEEPAPVKLVPAIEKKASAPKRAAKPDRKEVIEEKVAIPEPPKKPEKVAAPIPEVKKPAEPEAEEEEQKPLSEIEEALQQIALPDDLEEEVVETAEEKIEALPGVQGEDAEAAPEVLDLSAEGNLDQVLDQILEDSPEMSVESVEVPEHEKTMQDSGEFEFDIELIEEDDDQYEENHREHEEQEEEHEKVPERLFVLPDLSDSELEERIAALAEVIGEPEPEVTESKPEQPDSTEKEDSVVPDSVVSEERKTPEPVTLYDSGLGGLIEAALETVQDAPDRNERTVGPPTYTLSQDEKEKVEEATEHHEELEEEQEEDPSELNGSSAAPAEDSQNLNKNIEPIDSGKEAREQFNRAVAGLFIEAAETLPQAGDSDSWEISAESLESVRVDQEGVKILFDLAMESEIDPGTQRVLHKEVEKSEEADLSSDHLSAIAEQVQREVETQERLGIKPWHKIKRKSEATPGFDIALVQPSIMGRLSAFALDGVLQLIITLVIGAVIFGLSNGFENLSPDILNNNLLAFEALAIMWATFVAVLVIYPIAAFEISGNTVGSNLFKLGLLKDTARHTDFLNVISRALLAPLSYLLFGYLPVLAGRRPLHEKLSGTFLSKAPE